MKRLSFWTLFTVFMFTSTLPLTVSGQSTSLSLEPPSIEVPFVDLELGEIVVSVNLTFNNISYLKKFDLLLTFDGSMLEYYTDHAGDWGYGGSRSTSPHYGSVSMSGELLDERIISGSGTFYTFTFRVLNVGSSQISLQYIYLEDKFGSVIPYIISNDNVTTEIIPLETWVDGEYEELVQTYDLLLDDFQTLNATHMVLLSDYSSLNSDYDLLLDDFQTLNATHMVLLSDYSSLDSAYEQLDSDYDSLNDDYSKLKTDYEKKEEDISTKTNLMYLFVITTIALGGTVAYLVTKKKPRFQ